MLLPFVKIKNLFWILAPMALLISACQGISGQAGFQPTGIPLTVTIDTQGNIGFEVETSVEYPTPLGTLSAGLVIDPAQYFQAKNTLTVRLNNEDNIYDLHGQDFQVNFSSGYYENIMLEKKGENIFLVLKNLKNTSNTNITNIDTPYQISPPDGSIFDYYPRKTVLQWETVANASSYVVEIDCFHCCVENQWCTDVGQKYDIIPDITSDSVTIEYVGAQPGRWRVWAIGSNGLKSPKSPWWVFTYTR